MTAADSPSLPYLSQSLADGSFRVWVRRRLKAWFARNARDLPWRHCRDAYPIWISEVMLQQTQVATVIPYFARFLQRFPDLDSLARADEQEVLRLWEGLGYYRRARDLHQAARIVVAKHGGALPTDPYVLGGLPGFGRYTVNAVLSQAYDQPLPILEANSQRVLCRILGLRADPKSGAGNKALWAAAQALVPRRHAGAFNQALMELGAVVCKPDRPECGRCPLRQRCYARVHSLQDEIPLATKRARTVQVDEVAVVVWRRGCVLLVQRTPEGRWGSMWEFPRTGLEFLESPASAAGRLLGELGLVGRVRGELMSIQHTVTRFHITLVCLEANLVRGRFRPGQYAQGVWLRPGQLEEYPLSMPQRRLAARLTQRGAHDEGGAIE